MNPIKLGIIGTVILQNIKIYEINTEKISLSSYNSPICPWGFPFSQKNSEPYFLD